LIVLLWAIIIISFIFIIGLVTLIKYWINIKQREKKLLEFGSDDKDKPKREQIEKSINRAADSENLNIIGRYLTIIIAGFLFLIIVIVIGLVLIVK
jgi:uncharacterized membrane protein YvbJ